MNKYHITVLMSTYNGEKYICEQIDSILAQKDVEVTLLVRDDGSTDNTLNILERYKTNKKLEYYTGNNCGPQLSFMHLLQNSDDNDYYAFADQDDFWMEDKLICAINSMKDKKDVPALYLSQTQLTDESLNLKKSIIINPLLTFGESLIYKFAGGCTMVMNHKLRTYISDKMPDVMPMHDIWIYTFALSVNSHVTFDNTPHILYRQHTNNAVGQGQGFVYEWRQRLHRLLSQSGERHNQASELKKCYYDIITDENKSILNLFLEGKTCFAKRIKLIFDKRLRCSDKTTLLLFWINLLLNKY